MERKLRSVKTESVQTSFAGGIFEYEFGRALLELAYPAHPVHVILIHARIDPVGHKSEAGAFVELNDNSPDFTDEENLNRIYKQFKLESLEDIYLNIKS